MTYCFWIFLLAAAAVGSAQDNYEIQVYGADTVPRGNTMLELHSNLTVEGTKQALDSVLPSQHAWHETLEITHGWNDWFETGFYIFSAIEPHNGGWQYAGSHIRPRVRVPKSWGWPVGVSLSTEFGYVRPSFATDTWTLEIRPIVDQTLGRWYWAFNPALERSFHGASVSQGVVFSPAAKFAYDLTKKVAAGVEYYGSTGPLIGFAPFGEQQQQIFPALDFNLHPRLELNLGVGVGVTHSTDHLLVKMILGYRFGRDTSIETNDTRHRPPPADNSSREH